MAYRETRLRNADLKYFFNVSKSVGPAMPNSKTDVALVQALLCNCYDGGDIVRLKIDGNFGPKTGAAIRQFQADFSRFSQRAGLLALDKDGIVTRADNLGFDGPSGGIIAYTIVALNFTLIRSKPKVWESFPNSKGIPAFLRPELMKTVS
ncbi:MAG: peptidoglycan-binding protein [Bryobacterales bacterium]|nr:peptidoglycan-binding protein [Bryobacterales bacterium]